MNSFLSTRVMRALQISIVCKLVLYGQSALAFQLLHEDYGRSFYFVFNGGLNDGVKEGMTACVHDADGEELYCGKVDKVNASRAGVYVPAQEEAWIDLGYHVRVVELGGIPQNQPQWGGKILLHRPRSVLVAAVRARGRPDTWPPRFYLTDIRTQTFLSMHE